MVLRDNRAAAVHGPFVLKRGAGVVEKLGNIIKNNKIIMRIAFFVWESNLYGSHWLFEENWSSLIFEKYFFYIVNGLNPGVSESRPVQSSSKVIFNLGSLNTAEVKWQVIFR